ncbi:putative DNA repair protein RAD23-3 [Heracleum sosnowskyi]|uniref:DNA repair protein RAD23-3 n=1 Tax=Heracleum sosnowskyi TaxID=360622 RepID=A0AAD8MG18_9APIA|nr:putative DNA repair protein RAD23-3 [Heracleum sosnowskyi]
MEAVSCKKRVRHDSDESSMSLPDVKKLKEELLHVSDLPTIQDDLDYLLKTFEDEISAVDVSSDSCESQPELGFLLEASDDELGLPPPVTSLQKVENEVVRVMSESSETSELWGFEEGVSGYDSFDLGFADVMYDYNCNNGGEYVTVDGLFDYSDMGFGSSDILLHSETLPAL